MKKLSLSALYLLGASFAVTACNPSKSDIETPKPNMEASKPMQATQTHDVPGKTDEDHLYLEGVEGEAALDKVRGWNARSAEIMQTDTYKSIKSDLLEVYHSPDKIPYVSYHNGRVNNFWQDDSHKRGIWRSATLDSYMLDNISWETILDVDALDETEDKNWVYKGRSCLSPEYELCLVNLSVGGKDAAQRREFNVRKRAFVGGGFTLPISKGGVDWLDKDRLLTATDFGDGTMTESGYPRIVKLWTRGQELAGAQTLYEGKITDVGVWPGTFKGPDGNKEIMIVRAETFYKTQYFWLPQTGKAVFEPVKLGVPARSSLSGQLGDQQLLTLQEDWRGFKTGALISFAWSDFMQDGMIDDVHEVITPGPRQSIGNFGTTKSKVLLSLYDNVQGSALAFSFEGSRWTSQKLDLSKAGSVSIGSTNDDEDIAFIETESFLEPTSLWLIDSSTLEMKKAKSLPAWFDSSNMTAEQYEVTSTDGVKVPYFIVHSKDMKLDGNNPSLLYGYGGFEVSINPSYSATIGRAWLDQGGVYAVANIRGGGEFGPDWHQAGLKTNRQIVYDDFIAVAEDLIERGVTSPEHLGIHGRSNGGLLMGVMFTQRPDLFGAVAIGVPLLDMARYDKLLAGASWVGEYGDPDDQGEEGAFIRALSPYHNIDPSGDYPVPYIYTSTKDDRVHPGHARKFAQRLEDYGFDFLYYENIDGGHAGAANLEETASSQALIYSYMWEALK